MPNFYQTRRDAAEVVLYTSEHTGSLATIGVDGVRAVVDLWAERTVELMARDEVQYVLVFENRGAEVGATISHPHGQIYGFPAVPPLPRREAEVAAHQGCPLCTLVPAEVAADERIVHDGGDWIAHVPFAAGYPFATLLAPRTHVEDLPSLDDDGRDGLAAALVDIVGRYDRIYDEPLPYLMWIHPGVHLHVHFAPMHRAPGVLRYVASAEVGARCSRTRRPRSGGRAPPQRLTPLWNRPIRTAGKSALALRGPKACSRSVLANAPGIVPSVA